MKLILSAFLALACGAASAQVAPFNCVAPVFPDHSNSNEGVRRVDKQVKKWRACYQAYRAQPDAPDMSTLDAEVDANHARWVRATQGYSNGQGTTQDAMSRPDRDRVTTVRGESMDRARAETRKSEQ
jgi:hypothetical protein